MSGYSFATFWGIYAVSSLCSTESYVQASHWFSQPLRCLLPLQGFLQPAPSLERYQPQPPGHPVPLHLHHQYSGGAQQSPMYSPSHQSPSAGRGHSVHRQPSLLTPDRVLASSPFGNHNDDVPMAPLQARVDYAPLSPTSWMPAVTRSVGFDVSMQSALRPKFISDCGVVIYCHCSLGIASACLKRKLNCRQAHGAQASRVLYPVLLPCIIHIRSHAL